MFSLGWFLYVGVTVIRPLVFVNCPAEQPTSELFLRGDVL